MFDFGNGVFQGPTGESHALPRAIFAHSTRVAGPRLSSGRFEALASVLEPPSPLVCFFIFGLTTGAAAQGLQSLRSPSLLKQAQAASQLAACWPAFRQSVSQSVRQSTLTQSCTFSGLDELYIF